MILKDITVKDRCNFWYQIYYFGIKFIILVSNLSFWYQIYHFGIKFIILVANLLFWYYFVLYDLLDERIVNYYKRFQNNIYLFVRLFSYLFIH